MGYADLIFDGYYTLHFGIIYSECCAMNIYHWIIKWKSLKGAIVVMYSNILNMACYGTSAHYI